MQDNEAGAEFDTQTEVKESVATQETEISEQTESDSDTSKPEQEFDAKSEIEKLRKQQQRDARKIGKLTAIRHQQQRQLEELRGNFSNTQQPKQEGGGKPKESDFENYADYLAAMNAWQIEQKFAERDDKQRQTQQTSQQEAQLQQWAQHREHAVLEQTHKFVGDNPQARAIIEEYADLAEELPPEIQKLFLEAENAPLAFANLAKEGKLEALGKMSPYMAAATILQAQSKPFTKPVTKAPSPMSSPRGMATGGKPLERMSAKEILALARSG